MPRTSHHTAWAGVLATAAELSRRSYDVTLTLGNTPTTDLLCVGPHGSPFTLQVKSAIAPNFVLVQRRTLQAPSRADLFFVIVVVPEDDAEPFRFFVLTHDEVKAAADRIPPVTKAGKPRKPGWDGIRWADALPAEGRWDKLPSPGHLTRV